MKHLLVAIVATLPALVCFGVSAYLAVKGKEGWGWFLFVGLLCAGSITVNCADKS